MPRFLIERNFAEQVGLTKDAVAGISRINEEEGVAWIFSFLSADKKKTYCLYEAPNPEAIRVAARRLGVPADTIVEVGSEIGPLAAAIAPLREQAGKLESAIAAFAGPLLESIQFVRQYAGLPLVEGTKSVSFRLTVGSSERTLASEEVNEIRAAIIEGMRGLGYELRV